MILQLLLTATTVLAAQTGAETPMRIVIEQALDQPTELTLADVPLEEAFATIAERTGLSILIGPDAIDYLPYGGQTRISVELANIPLRSGIEAICNQLAMSHFVSDEGVAIIPSDPLVRLGRRATWEELDTVSRLMRTRWEGGNTDYGEISNVVQFNSPPDGETYDWNRLLPKLKAARSGRADHILTLACNAMGCTWFPWGRNIVILPMSEQTMRQLQRPVSVRFTSRPLVEVLQGLGREAGVRIALGPRAIAELPARIRQSYTLLADGATVEEALDQIAAAASLAYKVEADAVIFHPPGARSSTPKTAPVRRTDPIVGKIVVPGPNGEYQFEFFIRQSDLTDEEKTLRQEMIHKAREAMKQQLGV